MTNLLGTGQALDQSVNTVISKFLLLNDYPTVFQSCAMNLKLNAHDGVSKILNNYGRLTAFAVSDGADIAQAQSLADSATVATPSEVAVQTWLPGSTMRRAADPDLLGRTSTILHNALELKIDQDGGLQLPNFVPIIGVAGVVNGPGDYLAAATRLAIGDSRSNPEPPPKPWYTIDHPYKLAIVAGRMIPISDTGVGTTVYNATTAGNRFSVGPAAAGNLQNDLLTSGWMAMKELFGIPVKATANVIPNSLDDVSGASFSKEGLVYVEEIAPRIDPDTSDKSFRGAVELNGWCSYAWTLYRPSNFGVEILGDASTPVAS